MSKETKLDFSGVEDPRVVGRCQHKLCDILFIALCTLISNGEDYEDMVEFGLQRQDWLRKYLELPNGIPSHDTFNRVLQVVDPEQLKVVLVENGKHLLSHLEGQHISFDGKKIKGASPKSRGNKGYYILSAWANEHRICVGQEKINDKSNEITAIPELLDQLEVEGAIISIDAIGCQHKIAEKIVSKQADYLLAVKENQGSLHEEIVEAFHLQQPKEYDDQLDYGHGRIENRKCQILNAADVLSPNILDKWPSVKRLIKIHAKRNEAEELRYYISSKDIDSQAFFNDLVRSHWGIENHLHWHLDVTFSEDSCRARSKNAPENLNILRKIALQKVRLQTEKISLKKRRFRASMNDDYLAQIVFD